MGIIERKVKNLMKKTDTENISVDSKVLHYDNSVLENEKIETSEKVTNLLKSMSFMHTSSYKKETWIIPNFNNIQVLRSKAF